MQQSPLLLILPHSYPDPKNITTALICSSPTHLLICIIISQLHDNVNKIQFDKYNQMKIYEQQLIGINRQQKMQNKLVILLRILLINYQNFSLISFFFIFFLTSPFISISMVMLTIFLFLYCFVYNLIFISMRLVVKSRFGFGFTKSLYDTLYLNDPNHKAYNLASSSIHTQPNINTNVFNPVPPTYKSTKLPSGVTVLTESVIVPSNVQIGVFADVGTRDQDSESSGAMLLLKHAFLKTAINTNETVNYGIAQMAGSQWDVKYNNQNMFCRINCLSHDVIDVLSMMVDCAFEPRNVVACAVGRSKNEDAHAIDAQTGGNLKFNDAIYAAAFGGKGLGNPLGGRRSNIGNLSAQVIQKFQAANFTNDRIVISATGVENHQEFVDLVSEKLHFTQLGSTKPAREAAKYTGGELRNLTQSPNVHVAFAFEGNSYKDAYTLLVASEIFGHEGKSSFTRRNILDKNVFINDVQPFSASFSDSGIFGLKLAGSASHVNDIVSVGAKILGGLRSVSEADVQAAKASLKSRLSRRFSHASKRNEQMAKACYYLNETGEDYIKKIDSVTASSLQQALSKAVKGNLTFVVEGGEVSTIPSYDKVSQMLN